MEGGPRLRQTLSDEIESELDLTLGEEIRQLLEGGEVKNLELLLDKIEAYLVEAGVELTQDKKQQLRDILAQYGR